MSGPPNIRHSRQILAGSKYRSTKSITFDGLADMMAMFNLFGSDTFVIRMNQPSSVSLWIKRTKADCSREQIIINRWFPTIGGGLSINEGGWRMYLWDVAVPGQQRLVIQLCTHFLNGLWMYSNAQFPLNTWVHVAFTYDGTGAPGAGLKMFWDGVQQATTYLINNWNTIAINSNAYSHLLWGTQYTAWDPLGALPDWPPIVTWWFEGQMDETALYRYELTPNEVAALYDQGYPQSPLHVGLPARTCQSHHRMGELSDGVPFFGTWNVCWSRSPQTGYLRNAFWNNDGATPPGRVIEDSAP